MIVEEIKLFHASLLNSPIPRIKGGTPKMAATVRLSSSTMSDNAKSESDSGFICSTENCSAGINHGSPTVYVSIYSSNSLRLPAGLENSSVRPSTLMIRLGFHFDSMNPFSVAAACFRLLATSFKTTLSPDPFQGY